MKIFISHSKQLDYINELYRPIKDSTLLAENEFFFPYGKGDQINTKDVINSSDLIIAEVSLPSTGQGIELGWANILNIPIVCIYKEKIEISRSLRYISEVFLAYRDPNHLVEVLFDHLHKLKK